jgi:hypothetical protein
LLGSVNISGIVIQKQPVIDTWKNHNWLI